MSESESKPADWSYAENIKALTEGLNAGIYRAYEAGLRVALEVHHIGRTSTAPNGFPIVEAEVSRVLSSTPPRPELDADSASRDPKKGIRG